MNIRIPVQGLILARDGVRIVPVIGEPFEFTDEELAQIEKSAPKAIRAAVVEKPAPPAVVEKPAPAAPAAKKKGAEADL